MPEEMVIESMDKYGIDYALVSNIDSTELDFDQKEIPRELQINQVDSLERSIRFARAYPDRIGVLAWMKPYGETVTQELVDMLEKNRDIIYGLKFHPYHSKTAMDDPKVAPYLELARKFHFPVSAHTGGCEEAEPVHVRNAAEKYPDIDFIMVHMGLGSDNREAIRLLGTLPNLYGDTAWVPVESTVLAVETVGSETGWTLITVIRRVKPLFIRLTFMSWKVGLERKVIKILCIAMQYDYFICPFRGMRVLAGILTLVLGCLLFFIKS